MMEKFYPVSAARYRGLARLYVEHEEFKAYYEKYSAGLAHFLQAAILHYADTVLDV